MALPAATLNQRPRMMTLAEYLRHEETADQRHEFHDGEVLVMSGGTYAHATITTNLTATLHARLRGGDCRVRDSNLRVATASGGASGGTSGGTSGGRRFVYPDASIICGEAHFHPDDPNRTLINPRVIFEVLSDSTEAYDRGDKFHQYRQIDSLEEYILIGQSHPIVEGFLRQRDGTWSLSTWHGLAEVARVRCIGIELPLVELYAGVPFEAAAPASPSGNPTDT